jgi:hypothetical protein
VELRLLAPAALRPHAAQQRGPGVVHDPQEAGGERERERHARRVTAGVLRTGGDGTARLARSGRGSR